VGEIETHWQQCASLSLTDKENTMSSMQQHLNETPIVVIKRDYFGDYLVPEKNGELYFTGDRDDAVSTACFIYGADCRIRIRKLQ